MLETIVVLSITLDPKRTENPNNWNWNELLDLDGEEFVRVIACEAIQQPD